MRYNELIAHRVFGSSCFEVGVGEDVVLLTSLIGEAVKEAEKRLKAGEKEVYIDGCLYGFQKECIWYDGKWAQMLSLEVAR